MRRFGSSAAERRVHLDVSNLALMSSTLQRQRDFALRSPNPGAFAPICALLLKEARVYC
jgi:hypothetical protein